YLLTFMDICKSHHIRLICFSSSLFRPFVADMAYSRKLGALLEKSEIPYINYILNPYAALSSPSCWQDAYHLNAKGARIESQHIADDVKSILQLRH
ncbi:MAG: hypothetical protein ACHQRM_17965, partial [Bacteroidia bacterium]